MRVTFLQVQTVASRRWVCSHNADVAGVPPIHIVLCRLLVHAGAEVWQVVAQNLAQLRQIVVELVGDQKLFIAEFVQQVDQRLFLLGVQLDDLAILVIDATVGHLLQLAHKNRRVRSSDLIRFHLGDQVPFHLAVFLHRRWRQNDLAWIVHELWQVEEAVGAVNVMLDPVLDHLLRAWSWQPREAIVALLEVRRPVFGDVLAQCFAVIEDQELSEKVQQTVRRRCTGQAPFEFGHGSERTCCFEAFALGVLHPADFVKDHDIAAMHLSGLRHLDGPRDAFIVDDPDVHVATLQLVLFLRAMQTAGNQPVQRRPLVNLLPPHGLSDTQRRDDHHVLHDASFVQGLEGVQHDHGLTVARV